MTEKLANSLLYSANKLLTYCLTAYLLSSVHCEVGVGKKNRFLYCDFFTKRFNILIFLPRMYIFLYIFYGRADRNDAMLYLFYGEKKTAMES